MTHACPLAAGVVRCLPCPPDGPDREALLLREWLVTNGVGGYASGTIGGLATRRYHGLLVAALPDPLGRVVMLNHLVESVRIGDRPPVRLGAEEMPGRRTALFADSPLVEFRLEAGLPVWTYRIGATVLERRLVLPHRQNTAHVWYRLLAADAPVRLDLMPTVHLRHHEARLDEPLDDGYRLTTVDGHYQLSGGGFPPLRLLPLGAGSSLTAEARRFGEILYRVEESRGYEYQGALWSPGVFHLQLTTASPAGLVASAEPVEVATALAPEAAWQAELERRERLLATAPAPLRRGPGAELVLAADQFIVVPSGRLADAARAWAVGEEVRTVVAGYHWFTDWGRDTMISLEGIALCTGRHREAASILRTFSHHVRDGLIPNLFPDGSNEGLYHTADATLWFFHAVDRYLALTGDRGLLARLLPTLVRIYQHHREGTRFGIGMDPADGLLRQGAAGYQLTWMDAKVDDWVVTPRRGKAVEINALWYNALCLLADWLRRAGRGTDAAPVAALAERARRSFNRRFWYAGGSHLYDVVDGPEGDSAELRPNQLLALSLPHPVLERSRWEPVLESVRRRLLTPMGLRSLSPESPAYRATYTGDLRARDAAYHQGTVWAWLIGPWLDAWLKLHPGDREGARRFLDALLAHLEEYGVGSIAEIFDAEPPYTPRGCVAQAWSVAETLRCLLRTERDGV